MQKFSSFGRKKKKQTKIRHRMVMLEGLQMCLVVSGRMETHALQLENFWQMFQIFALTFVSGKIGKN